MAVNEDQERADGVDENQSTLRKRDRESSASLKQTQVLGSSEALHENDASAIRSVGKAKAEPSESLHSEESEPLPLVSKTRVGGSPLEESTALGDTGVLGSRPRALQAPADNGATAHDGTALQVEEPMRPVTPKKTSLGARAPTELPESAIAPTQAAPPVVHDGIAQIGQYEIIRKLGEGGMGVVYLARDSRLGRRVAIKVLRTQDAELTRRFIVEARTTARCTHENIVIIHDAGEHESSPFMVLEYLEGKALSDYLASEPPTIPHAVEIMVSVVRALVRAHEEGIVHRDLKPDNIFITDSGTVKVLDFGIAKLLHNEGAPSQTAQVLHELKGDSFSGPEPLKLSATGIAGTAGYMSPEQWQTPGDIDHRADIWAVGCTLFELVSGRNPLTHLGTPLAVATFLAGPEDMPTALSYGAKIPKQLSEIIARCLAKNRDERFEDARQLLKALEPFLPGRRQALDEQMELGPFAGLRAFQEEDASRFFGRSRELGTLMSRLRETPLMATVGPSGVGKSSFLRAGVIPALKAAGAGWEVLVCRPGRTPMLALVELLRPYLNEFSARRSDSVRPAASDEDLARRLVDEPGFLGAVLRERCRGTEGRIMLFVDQFEELYTLGADTDERHAFTRALLGAADDAVSPLRVMLSIRADFLGRTTEDQEFVTTLSKGLFFLGPPSEQGLREALVRPLEMVGYRFESGKIVDEMIQFLNGTPNGLPLLQFTAAQLWEARDPQNRLLTLQSYRGMGGVEGALVSHADSVYNQLAPELQVLCRTLFMHLVTQERTRAIRSMRELHDLAGNEKSVKQLVELLVESRLWVVTTLEGEATVEVVHESLISTWPSLRRWLDESHEDSVFIDQLMTAANQWAHKNRDAGLLWRGDMVAELEHFERRFRGTLPEIVREFVSEVRRSEQKSARRKRGMMFTGVLLLVGMLVAASVGLLVVNQERHKADENARIAEKRLEEQIRAEKQRTLAEQERAAARESQKVAEKKTDVLQDKVKLNAEELAAKNVQLESALESATQQQKLAQRAQLRAEKSEGEAKEATKRAEKAAKELKVLLDKERARSERLNAQIGTLVEDL